MRGDYYGELDDVIEFYSNFSSPEELMDWMRSRPPAPIVTEVVEGDAEVTAVVPTADLRGKLAANAREQFKGIRLVLVESNGRYFNYARSVNAGVSEALKERPKWIVISNDDVYLRDPLRKLREELSTLSPGDRTLVHSLPGVYHSYRTFFIEVAGYFPRLMKQFGKLSRNRIIDLEGSLYIKYGKTLRVTHLVLQDLMAGPLSRFPSLAGKVDCTFLNVGSFGIISASLARDGPMDITFINSHEDVLLSLESKPVTINFRVQEEMGGTLGTSAARFARSFANMVYLSMLARERELCVNWRDFQWERYFSLKS